MTSSTLSSIRVGEPPCDRLLPVLGPQHVVVEHRKALPHPEVAAAIGRVRRLEPDKVDTPGGGKARRGTGSVVVLDERR